MESLLAESYQSEFKEFIDSLFVGRPQQYLLHKKTFHVVRILALLGKVIIVGRGGAMVTRDIPGGINVRLVAPEVTRVRWMMHKLSLDKDAALKLVRKQDADRRRLASTFFRKDADDPLNYDVVWNSETVNPHEMSRAVIGMLNRRFGGKVRED
jgi:cytidylate kinase